MIVLQIGVCITIGAARLNATKLGATDASRLIVVVAHVYRRDVTSFKRFQDIIGRILIQHLVAVFASNIQATFLIPVVGAFDDSVFVLAVVPALIPDMVELCPVTFRTRISHTDPIIPRYVLEFESVFIGYQKFVCFDNCILVACSNRYHLIQSGWAYVLSLSAIIRPTIVAFCHGS